MSEDAPSTRELLQRIAVVYSYARVSQDRNKKEKSVTTQLRENAATCDAEGWPAPREFRDDGISASTYSKKARDGEEGYETMCTLIADDQADMLVVPAADRLSRSVEEWIPLRRSLQRTATLLCIDGEIYDMRNSRHRAQVTREIMTAEEEADRIRDRNARTARARGSVGEVHGRRLYGYAREYDSRTRELIRQYPDPETAPIVREVFERVAAREPLFQICRSLNERGVPTPGTSAQWGPMSLRNIAKNPAYEGVRVYNGVERPAVWDPIVPPLLARQARAVLAERAKPKHSNRSRWLLSGIAKCGRPLDEDAAASCGGGMYRRVMKRCHPVYACLTCHRVSITQEVLDYYVETVVLGWLEVPGRREMVLSGLGQERAAEALAELRALEAEQEEAYALARSGRLSAIGLSQVEQRVLPAIKKARRIVDGAVVPEVVMRMATPDVRLGVWPEADLAQRRELIKRVVQVEVLPSGQGVRSARQVVSRRTRLTWLLDQGTA